MAMLFFVILLLRTVYIAPQIIHSYYAARKNMKDTYHERFMPLNIAYSIWNNCEIEYYLSLISPASTDMVRKTMPEKAISKRREKKDFILISSLDRWGYSYTKFVQH